MFSFRAEEIDGASTGLKKNAFSEWQEKRPNVLNSCYTCGEHGQNTSMRFAIGHYRVQFASGIRSYASPLRPYVLILADRFFSVLGLEADVSQPVLGLEAGSRS